MLIAGCLLFCGVAESPIAEPYPVRPVRIIVGLAPGGTNDILARVIGQWLSERFGQPFVLENRPGAGGNIGTEAVVRSAPDGHTLLFTGTNNAINATLYENLSFNFLRDIAPVAGVVRQPLMILVNPSVPARTVPELITYAKANPGKLNIASPGNGTAPHVAGALLKMMGGINMVHVPYRGTAPALTDLIGGQVQVMLNGPVASMEYVKAGKLRALAVTGAGRWEGLPQLPTVAEFLPGYEASAWFGIGAPKATPAEIVERLNSEINAGLADPKLRAKFADLGASVLTVSPTEFGTLIAEETQKWATVIREANIKPE
jgi:tripartite-type tricarboxylate transporter receptor subunit TctC